MRILIADMGESIDSSIKKLINSNGKIKNFYKYLNDPILIKENISKYNYDIIAVNCEHPRGKSIAALLHEKKNNNEISSTIAEVYQNNEKQIVKTYK